MKFKLLVLLTLIASSSKGQMILKATKNYIPFVAPVLGTQPDRILDTFISPIAAYSLRKLSKAYTGNAIKVFNSTTSLSTGIGFTANDDLDTVALKSFCGSNTCSVTIWYDQSGNGRNDSSSQTTGIPIVKSGIVVRDGLKPAFSFEGGWFDNITNMSATTVSTFTVAKLTTNTGGYQRLVTFAPDLYFFSGVNGSNQITTFYGNGSAWGTTATQSTTTWLNTSRLVTSINNGNDNQYVNGTLISSRSNPMGAWTGKLFLGGVFGVGVTGQLWHGTMSELIVYDNDKLSVRTGIEGNMNRYYIIYP